MKNILIILLIKLILNSVKIEEQTGDDAPQCINVGSEDIIIELITVGLVSHRAVANIIFHSCR